jgi:hypothetical protein
MLHLEHFEELAGHFHPHNPAQFCIKFGAQWQASLIVGTKRLISFITETVENV